MKLEMTGHDSRKREYVSTATLKKVSGGNATGYFATDIDWDDATDPIKVKFTNTIYINKELEGQKKKDVEAHEEKHFNDFKALAAKLKKAIENVKEGGDAQMQDRIDWFLYDKCVSSANFHRKETGYSVEICSKPSSTRPA